MIKRLLPLALLLGPGAALAQTDAYAVRPPLVYHTALARVPLYPATDAAGGRGSSNMLPPMSAVLLLGEVRPGWATVYYKNFHYVLETAKLVDYDPSDAAALPLNSRTGHISFRKTLALPGVSEQVLWRRARAWLARTYDPGSITIEKQDSVSGQLVAEGTRLSPAYQTYYEQYRTAYAGVVHHRLSITVQDGQAHFSFSNLTHDAAGSPYTHSGGPLEASGVTLFGLVGMGSTMPWDDLRLKAIRDVRHLAEGLESALTLQPVAPAAPAAPAAPESDD